jgi:hypothetical protein
VKLLTEYLERAAQLENLAADESDPEFKVRLLNQANAYRKLAAKRALQSLERQKVSGPKCKDRSKPEFGLWTCPGPAGYAARFADEGNMVSLTLAPSGSIAKVGPTAQWRGAD